MFQKPWMKVLGSVLLAFAVTAAFIALMSAIGLSEDSRLGHFGFHAALAASFGILFFTSRRVWPAPREGVERGLRKLLVLGFILALIGSTLESLGALGYGVDDGNTITNEALASVHNIGLVFTTPGLPVILVGLIGTFVVRILFRIRKKPVVT
ncbi:MAG: hypothetical protein HW379_1351 [Actinobacteria bacterium]|jgi:hypothetical protein|nr:hypothetical protein [Actinomycetota bacterium]